MTRTFGLMRSTAGVSARSKLPPPPPPKNGSSSLRALVGATLFVLASAAHGQTWTPLARNAPAAVDEMNLLTDGSVLVHHADFSANDSIWYRLTPDSSGSYVNGTWTQVASLPNGYAPIDFASAVLPDGRVVVEGGEYQAGVEQWTNQGAIYDPRANRWTPISPPPGWTLIGDAPSAVLANGTFMLGQSGSATKANAQLNANTLTWTITGSGKFDANAEEGWTLLPNGKILNVDAYFGQYDPNGTNSELYNPSTGTWSSAGSTVVQLWDSAAACGGQTASTFELGPMALRPDGTVFAIGANSCGAGHTAIYNTRTGAWTPGPDLPLNLSAGDAPAATETNGNVLLFVSPNVFGTGGRFFEWNGVAITNVPLPSPEVGSEASFPGKMLTLPNGQILFTHYASDLFVFTPNGTFQSAWQPTISSVSSNLTPGQTFTISGTQFNGLHQGAWYGDDAATATNYPLVRLVNSATGHVVYCRTHDHSTMAVATGTQTVSTSFDVPANAEAGPSQLFVVANGIPSRGVAVTVGTGGGGGSVSLSPGSFDFGTVPVNGFSDWHAFTLSNTGTTAVSISNAAATGPFSVSSTCGSSLAAGANCTIWVLFAPTSNGQFTGTLTVTDSASNSPQTASLRGTGGSGGGNNLTLSPASLNFGTVPVNGFSSWQAFSLSNPGTTAVPVSQVSVSGPFSVVSYCGSSLAAGSKCDIYVLFAPTSQGTASGTLTAVDGAANSPQTSNLTGFGQ